VAHQLADFVLHERDRVHGAERYECRLRATTAKEPSVDGVGAPIVPAEVS
jgi:hypothetical protein